MCWCSIAKLPVTWLHNIRYVITRYSLRDYTLFQILVTWLHTISNASVTWLHTISMRVYWWNTVCNANAMRHRRWFLGKLYEVDSGICLYCPVDNSIQLRNCNIARAQNCLTFKSRTRDEHSFRSGCLSTRFRYVITRRNTGKHKKSPLNTGLYDVQCYQPPRIMCRLVMPNL